MNDDNTSTNNDIPTKKMDVLLQRNWDDDEDDDYDDNEQEIGIKKTHSNKNKSLTSQDMQRNVSAIVDDDSEQQYQDIYHNAKGLGYRHDGHKNKDDDEFGESNLPPRGYGGQRQQNPDRYQNRPPFQPRPKFDESNIDMESNFRKYYIRDRSFYMHVIKEEEPPGDKGYRFKVHIFQKSDDELEAKEQEKKVFFTLMDLGADEPRMTMLQDKIRVFCNVLGKDNAIYFYQNLGRSLEEPLKCSIFLEFPEEIFVKHGDIMAQKYDEQQEADKKRIEQQKLEREKEYQQYSNKNNYDNRNQDNQQDYHQNQRNYHKEYRGGYNDQHHSRGGNNNSSNYKDRQVTNYQADNHRGGGQYSRHDNDHYQNREFHQNRDEYSNNQGYQGNNNRKEYNNNQQHYNRQDHQGRQGDYGNRHTGGNYKQANYHQDNQRNEDFKDSDSYGIEFKGKPQFYKSGNPNEEDHRKVIDTSKQSDSSQSKQTQGGGVRTVINNDTQQQNTRQVYHVDRVHKPYDDNQKYDNDKHQNYNNNRGGNDRDERNSNRGGYKNQRNNNNYDRDEYYNSQQDSGYKQGRGGYQGNRYRQDYQDKKDTSFQGGQGFNNYRGRGGQGRGGYDGPRNDLQLKKADSRSNYDYENRSQISDNVSHHSFKTDNQNYKNVKRRNVELYDEEGQQYYTEKKGNYNYNQQNDSQRYGGNQRGFDKNYQGGNRRGGYNNQRR
ncbi:UNKNOWN [Stylonychia lemnae]|uniref:Uncharacterized protein n=1 Tax=Stylonychia lemnae TaxID=5949 RepID=A0A077ZX04_STYLE|nr:UNKNOWN [Stylonychia lemnae]|eukprot:CDW74441.1 UNKNOWN [Stylonychia lemnae]